MKISLATAFVSLLSLAANAQNVVNVDVPKVNEMIYNKELLNITYSIIGTQTSKAFSLDTNGWASFFLTSCFSKSSLKQLLSRLYQCRFRMD